MMDVTKAKLVNEYNFSRFIGLHTQLENSVLKKKKNQNDIAVDIAAPLPP